MTAEKTDKITSIAELRKWAEDRIVRLKLDCKNLEKQVVTMQNGRWSEKEIRRLDRLQARIDVLIEVLDILRELEASVRKRLKLFELCDKHPETKCEDCQNVEICKTCTVGKELLRRVLEGEKK